MVKIGMIGMSPGNAHPYSWSSIVNGTYDASEIIRVGYPGVADYLVANKDTLGFNNARVTHLWTQNRATSQSIARSAGIKNIVDDLSVMVSEVDAVILARDDAEHHVEMAKPFLDNGIPIFIDKPLAISRKDLLWFTEQDSKSKFLMSCSSMRYATECRALKAELATLGKIILVTAVGKKDWLKYGVHMLEAVFSLLDDPIPVTVRHSGVAGKDIVYVNLENEIQVSVHLFKDISSTFQITVFGENGWKLIDIRNSYAMFRDNLIEFIRSVEEGSSRLAFKKTINIIDTLISAQDSLQQNGKLIKLV